MKPYQAIARAFRPQQFTEVLQQEAVVTTLQNAIVQDRVAHAYLFSGGRGSGKTTLARLFAKALNCSERDAQGNPCNKCASCKEIASGSSLDLIEIDGASARGIDDIRQINETIGYSPSSGGYRIYLIDEVHMLTKEAFNALLKTLEEPPPRAKFFFATTEPHKIPDTIKSRCQHFPLKRISEENIIKKLKTISAALKADVEEGVFGLIAARAEGSLRDAESMLDQLLSSTKDRLTAESAAHFFGMAPREFFEELDKAFQHDDLSFAFKMSSSLNDSGADLAYIFDQLIQHYRESLQKALKKEKSVYSDREALQILEYLLKAQGELKGAISLPIKLEAALLFIISLHKKLSLEKLVDRLEQLETRLASTTSTAKQAAVTPKAAIQVELPRTNLEIKPLSTTPKITSSELSKTPKAASPEATRSVDKHRQETILQFAAVELEGTIKRH